MVAVVAEEALQLALGPVVEFEIDEIQTEAIGHVAHRMVVVARECRDHRPFRLPKAWGRRHVRQGIENHRGVGLPVEPFEDDLDASRKIVRATTLAQVVRTDRERD
jgi:hypothetical protein